MPTIRQEGKDTIIFASKEDHATPSKISLPEPEPSPGLLLPNGDINWNCPCLGGMATGPCGVEFRDAFSCFHYSSADPKGSDCLEAFKSMQSCMSEYPALYGNREPDLDDLEGQDAEAIDDRGREQRKSEDSIEEIKHASSKSNELELAQSK